MRTLVMLVVLVGGAAFADDAKTARMWKTKCQSCHGADGKAQTDKGKKMQIFDMSSAEWQAKKTDDELKKAIKTGTRTEKDGVKKEMDAYDDLSDEQLSALVAHVRGFKK